MLKARTASRHHTARRVIAATVVVGSLAGASSAAAQSVPPTSPLTIGPLPAVAAKEMCVSVDAVRHCVKTPAISGTVLTVKHTAALTSATPGAPAISAPTITPCTGGFLLQWSKDASTAQVSAEVTGTTPLGTAFADKRSVEVPFGARAMTVALCDEKPQPGARRSAARSGKRNSAARSGKRQRKA